MPPALRYILYICSARVSQNVLALRREISITSPSMLSTLSVAAAHCGCLQPTGKRKRRCCWSSEARRGRSYETGQSRRVISLCPAVQGGRPGEPQSRAINKSCCRWMGRREQSRGSNLYTRQGREELRRMYMCVLWLWRLPASQYTQEDNGVLRRGRGRGRQASITMICAAGILYGTLHA